VTAYTVILASIATVIVVVFLVARRTRANFDRRQQEVVQVLTAAGYSPFGPEGSYARTFQSNDVAVRVEWGHGYVSASFERRRKPSGWLSERVLREALFHEPWDPAVKPPLWESDDIAMRLRERLATMARAVASDDPEMKALLATTQVAQRRRFEEHLEMIGAAARARREQRS
jgi:hypothetical protein